MNLTKQSLGMGYLVGTGVILSAVLLIHAVSAIQSDAPGAIIALVGFVPALGLAGAKFWLPRSGLKGEQIWTVAEWSGLGVAIFTLLTVAILVAGFPVETFVPRVLAASIALGGAAGILVGTLLELRRSTRRLSQSNDVLNRVLRHNLRNDLNVVLGHVSQIEREVPDQQARHVERLRRKIDDIIAMSDKARQIDVALAADGRPQQPVDVVPYVEERIDAVRAAYPDARVETDLPEEAWVYADWLLATLLDNVVENAVVHAQDAPQLAFSVERSDGVVTIEVADSGPEIPEDELDVLTRGSETQLHHSKGVGLWLVQWIVESYDGDVRFERDGTGNVVVIELPAAPAQGEGILRHKLNNCGSRPRLGGESTS